MSHVVIDLGTNSIRFARYSIDKYGEANCTFREKIPVRLGDNLFKSQVLNEEAIDRTISAFKTFRRYLDDDPAEHIRAVATCAVREARNGKQFAKKVLDKTGFKLDIISGKEEARLIAIAVNSIETQLTYPRVLIDIGGGSTEITVCSSPKKLKSVSFPLGAERCQQTFLTTIPPAQTGIRNLRTHVDELLHEAFPDIESIKGCDIIGSSGSIKAFGKIHEVRYGTRRSYSYNYLKNIIHEMKALTRDELLTLRGLQEKRVHIILASGIVLERIINYFDSDYIHVTDCGLKEGVILEML